MDVPKQTLGPQTLLLPMPALLVGANVDGIPNFMTAAWGGIACSKPPMLTIAFQHHRHTYRGVLQNRTFSVCVPSASLATEVDYLGLVSGSKQPDKVAIAGLDIFYGDLGSAPLITQCPVGLECRLEHILDLGSHALVVGRIIQSHVSASCMTDGHPDPRKIDPLVYAQGKVQSYHRVGEQVAEAFRAGLQLRKRD